ncbi:MAG: hypothetical protein F4X40_01810 [Chloroflexi bacterium]|nr:hypothetical protein [Chloroflexota bacterium]
MKALRVVLMLLGIVHILFVGLTAVVGSFADGGDVWSRLLLTLLHPIAAIAILFLVFVRIPPRRVTSIVVGILAINIVADVVVAALIASGSIKGDWGLPLAFVFVPAIAIVYAVLILRSHDELSDAE